MAKIGYSFWGFLSDYRIKGLKLFSSPDGNFIYSWAILHELVKQGHQPVRMLPDRDTETVEIFGSKAFASFAEEKRAQAYDACYSEHLHTTENIQWPDLDVLLLEWRWAIPGRNTYDDLMSDDFQPDYILQCQMIEHYKKKGIPIIAFDLDYKMTPEDDKTVDFVLELGLKRGPEHQVCIPFDLQTSSFPLCGLQRDVVYIGNRYERDHMIDKYLTPNLAKSATIKVYGNWNESGRKSTEQWPHIAFQKRIHPFEFRDAYATAACTPLLLKDEYNRNGFMTARILEAAFYGCPVVLPEEFQIDEQNLWAPALQKIPRISSDKDLIDFVATLDANKKANLVFSQRVMMQPCIDASNFVSKLLSFVKQS